MIVVPHPPYLPDLAPSYFFLFLKLKVKLKGRRFQTEEIQAELQAVLNTLRETGILQKLAALLGSSSLRRGLL